jgi:hypothetical protein
MSTKIYNAYRVCDNKIETVFKIKKEMEPLYAEKVYKNLDLFGKKTLKATKNYMKEGYVFWDVINRFVLEGSTDKVLEKKLSTPLNEMPYYDLQYVLKGFIDQQQNDPLNFEASMVLIEHKGNMYIQFFGFSHNTPFDDYIAGLIKDGVITDWHYQNQTDVDDAIDDDDWEDRETMWDEVYTGGWDGYNSPAEVGFSHDFFDRIFTILYKYSIQKAENNKEATN